MRARLAVSKPATATISGSADGGFFTRIAVVEVGAGSGSGVTTDAGGAGASALRQASLTMAAPRCATRFAVATSTPTTAKPSPRRSAIPVRKYFVGSRKSHQTVDQAVRDRRACAGDFRSRNMASVTRARGFCQLRGQAQAP